MTAQRARGRVRVDRDAGEQLGGGSLTTLKRFVVGRPLATHAQDSELLPKRIALPVFSSDAVSSTAYGTEVMLTVLVPVAGVAAFGYLVPLSLVLIGVLTLLVLSYRQTIYAYPNGGGSYIVSRENLGTNASLVACAALLVDYTLNVAVSAAAGAAAISSAIAPLQDHPIALSVGLVAVIMFANLRGLREAGRLFALPVYTYVAVLTLLIVDGLIRSFTGSLHQLPVNHTQLNAFTHNGALVTGVTLFALMKAFSSGAVALSGVEAISNGVPAFREPKSRNAATTMIWTGLFLGGPLLGLAVLTNRLRPTISTKETLISILGDHVFGRGSPLYIILMASAALILCLSANTSFADFPRLSSIVARDGFLPHQLARRGDRLVFSNGIIAVAASAVVLLFAFNGNLVSLIPLFAVGLFTAFTLSQVGMVRHHRRLREPGWRVALAINATGATATSIVLIVILISKFTAGAWIPAVVIPLVVMVCKLIKRHYDAVERQLALPDHAKLPAVHNTVIVPINAVDKGALDALAYARALRPERLVAVVVDLEDTGLQELRRRWQELDLGVTLEIVESPYRDITRPLLAFVNEVDSRRTGDIITVVLPEVVVHHWWHQLLHNQTALALKGRLLFRPNTIVISVPTQVD
ncbi:MAG TPA: APC family permease [Acidimicrobiia bacterium]